MAGRVAGENNSLCAEVSNHRGFTGVYPETIQSFIRFTRENRSNSAQSGPSSFTPLGPGGLSAPLYPKLFSTLSPGPPCQTLLGPLGSSVHTRGGWYVQGVPRVVVYTRVCTRWVCTRVCTRWVCTRVYLRCTNQGVPQVYQPGCTSGCTNQGVPQGVPGCTSGCTSVGCLTFYPIPCPNVHLSCQNGQFTVGQAALCRGVQRCLGVKKGVKKSVKLSHSG